MRVGPFGSTELIIILVIVLVIFGAGRITEIFGALGRGIREFRKSQTEEDPPASTQATGRKPAKKETKR